MFLIICNSATNERVVSRLPPHCSKNSSSYGDNNLYGDGFPYMNPLFLFGVFNGFFSSNNRSSRLMPFFNT